MALEEYAGAIVMEIDGAEVEIESLDYSTKTGRKLVKTMNKTGHAKGFAKGVAEHDLKLTVVIPLTGDRDWGAIEGVKIRIYPLDAGEKVTVFYDCFTVDVSEKYQVDGEAKRDINMQALRKGSE